MATSPADPNGAAAPAIDAQSENKDNKPRQPKTSAKNSETSKTELGAGSPPVDTGDPTDPFDPAGLRIDATSDANLGVERPLLVVPVQKPSKQMFFRTHPSPEMRLDARVIELETEREFYLVTPAIAQMLPGETKAVRLIACMPRFGGIFLWPLKLPNPDGRESTWAVSARKAAELAEGKWVRMQANQALGAYDVSTSAHIPAPVWPEVSMRELLQIAFGDGRLIDREDHPVIRQLLGLR
jgi:hypothetical protein